jgi:pimeloyl-ACP methyl ester carboxylesterase
MSDEQRPPVPHQDFSILDRPEVLRMMFYPRPDAAPAPPGSLDVLVGREPEATIACRWHPLTREAPALLFFHGNGEVVADYDGLAQVYHRFRMSLFVGEYRGYGASTGRPSFTALLGDALAIATVFHQTLDAEGVTGPRFLMGRSLGALSAVEIAARAPERFRGLILESGTAGVRGWGRFARPSDDPAVWEQLRAAQIAKLNAITLPLLTIHGEWDDLVPLDSALEVRDAIGSTVKELEIIRQAGHNDLLSVAPQQYFGSIRDFIALVERPARG